MSDKTGSRRRRRLIVWTKDNAFFINFIVIGDRRGISFSFLF